MFLLFFLLIFFFRQLLRTLDQTVNIRRYYFLSETASVSLSILRFGNLEFFFLKFKISNVQVRMNFLIQKLNYSSTPETYHQGVKNGHAGLAKKIGSNFV